MLIWQPNWQVLYISQWFNGLLLVSWVVVRNIIKVRVIIETEGVVEELKIGLWQFCVN